MLAATLLLSLSSAPAQPVCIEVKRSPTLAGKPVTALAARFEAWFAAERLRVLVSPQLGTRCGTDDAVVLRLELGSQEGLVYALLLANLGKSRKLERNWTEPVDGFPGDATRQLLIAAARELRAAEIPKEQPPPMPMLTDVPGQQAKPPQPAPTTTAVATPDSSIGAVPVILWSAAAASFVAGGAFGLRVLDHRDRADPTHVGSQLNDEKGRLDRRRANIAFAVGGAALAAGIVVYLWPASTDAAITVTPTDSGATMRWLARF